MVTIRDMLALSPEMHARLRDDITSKRVINTRPNKRNTMLTEAVDTDPLPFTSDSEDHVSVLHLGPTAEGPCPHTDDAVEKYMRDHPVGKESGALHTVWPVVANREEVECILDLGSQVEWCLDCTLLVLRYIG